MRCIIAGLVFIAVFPLGAQELPPPPGAMVTSSTEPSEFDLTRNVDNIRAARDHLKSQFGERHPNVVLYSKQLIAAEQSLALLRARNAKIAGDKNQSSLADTRDRDTAIIEIQSTVLKLSTRLVDLESEIRELKEQVRKLTVMLQEKPKPETSR